MKERFDKLPYGVVLEDLKISKRNKQYVERVLKEKSSCSDERITKYRNALIRFADLVEKDFDKLTREEVNIANGIVHKKSNFSPKTKLDMIKEVRNGFKFLFGDDEDLPKVIRGLKAPELKGSLRLPDVMPTEKDVIKMIKATPNNRDKFLIALMGLDSGIRPIELRNILLKDIKKDKYGHFITIRTAKKSGDKDTRSIRLIKSEPYFVKWMNEYPAIKDDDAYLFINYSNLKPMNRGTITALFNRLKKKLGMKKLYPYLLRHQWITRASKDPRWSPHLLKKFVGHSLASNTLAEYIHHGDDDIKDAQLLVNGIKKSKEVKELNVTPLNCPKCKKSNEYDAEFCSFCNFALSQKRQLEINEILEKNNKVMFDQVEKMVKKMMNKTPKAKS